MVSWQEAQAIGLKCCHSESQLAAELRGDPRRFYTDYEMVAADVDPRFGGLNLSRLASDWRGHRAGSLVLAVFTGVSEMPPYMTWMVEDLPG